MTGSYGSTQTMFINCVNWNSFLTFMSAWAQWSFGSVICHVKVLTKFEGSLHNYETTNNRKILLAIDS